MPAVATCPSSDSPSTVGSAPTSPATSATFDDLGLPPELLAAVRALGFVSPTPIQARAIPALLAGRDVVGLAPTGTGKTAAFGLPILAAVDPADGTVQALVLTPTRELALQVATAVEGMAAAGERVTAIYGGAPIGPQIGALRRGSQIVVGTPGRVIDHLRRGTLDLSSVATVVLDEADEMLQMGFAEEIDEILVALPTGRRTALFSATMPPAIRSLAARHLTDPIDVTVAAATRAAVTVSQQYAVVPSPERTAALVRVLSTRVGGATIVFVRTRAGCQELGAELAAHGIAAAAISGDIAQAERERIIERLRDGRLRVLVATDVAARGLDVDRIDHVVNYGAPNDPESYVHRVGRTGRAGRTGEALTLVTPREIGRIRTIEKATGVRMVEVVPPTAADVVSHRVAVLLSTAVERQRTGALDRHRRTVAEFLDREGIDAADLAAALVALAAGDYPTAEQEAVAKAATKTAAKTAGKAAAPRTRPEKHGEATPDVRRVPRGGAAGGANRQPLSVYRVDVGRAHGVRPAAIVGAITGEGGMTGKDVGRIDIYDTYSTVEIGAAVTPVAWERISRAKVSGRPLKLRRDTREPAAGRPARETSAGRHPGRRQVRDETRPFRTASAGPRRQRG